MLVKGANGLRSILFYLWTFIYHFSWISLARSHISVVVSHIAYNSPSCSMPCSDLQCRNNKASHYWPFVRRITNGWWLALSAGRLWGKRFQYSLASDSTYMNGMIRCCLIIHGKWTIMYPRLTKSISGCSYSFTAHGGSRDMLIKSIVDN